MLDSTAMRSIPPRVWALVLVSAGLQLLPFPLAGPVPLWRRSVCWFCLVPLLGALNSGTRQGNGLSLGQSAMLGYVCGVVWFFGNCYWIYQTMYLYGGLPAAASVGILVLFSLYLGLYLALFAVLYAALRMRFREKTALALSPVLWVAVELARARITGFPWDLLGYTQVDNSWLTPLAPLTGVMGLSLVVAAGNVLWLWKFPPPLRWAGALLAAVLVAVSYAGEVHRSPPDPASANAVLLQDNLNVGAQGKPFGYSQPELLDQFSRLSLHPRRAGQGTPGTSRITDDSRDGFAAPALIAWPEAPTPFADADAALREAVGNLARGEHAPVVVQAEGAGRVKNSDWRVDEFVSASFFLPDGSYAGRYDKMHLVPFGEYTPYKQLFFFAGHLLDGLVLVPGTQRRVFNVNGHRFGVFICYESIFGDEVREFAQSGAQVLVNLSDDGWYGDTSAPWEHLDMARMRAIENRRWLLRDTNTGLTASIDPQGRIVAALPRHTRDAIEVPFGYRSDLTFYTRHGDWIGWLCALVIAAVLAGGALQQRFGPGRVD